MERKKIMYAFCACAVCSGLIAGIVLIAVSFHTLEATEMGLDFSDFTKTIDEEVLYTTGRHFLGPAHSFIVYPTEQLTIDFKYGSEYGILRARTRDALPVDLEVSFQYRLNANLADVLSLYRDWGLKYRQAFAVVARNVLRDVAAEYEAYDFFYDRLGIQLSMTERLGQAVSKVYTKLDLLQLQEVTLPQKFDVAIQEAETVRQQAVKVELDKGAAVVSANNRRDRVDEQAAAVLNEKRAQAQVTKNSVERTIQEFVRELDAETNSLAIFANESGIPPTGMMDYIWLQNYGQGKSSTRKAGLDKPLSLLCLTDPAHSRCPAAVTEDGRSDAESVCDLNGVNCDVQVRGSKLSGDNLLLLAPVSSSCPPSAVDASPFVSALTGSLSTAKIYNIPTGHVQGTTPQTTEIENRVCICIANEQAAGCRHAKDFTHNAGTATWKVTPPRRLSHGCTEGSVCAEL